MIIKVLFLLITLFSCRIFAADSTKVSKANTTKSIKTTISALVGFPFPSQSSAFTDVYFNKLGGKNDYYKPTVFIALKLYAQLLKDFDIGIALDHFGVDFRDGFINYLLINNKLIPQEITESVIANITPLTLILQYTSLRTSYTSYAGIGAGVSFNSIKWSEVVNNGKPVDIRKGGEIFNSKVIAPSIKIYAGTMLDFDKKDEKEFLGAFHFEASFCYTFSSLSIFENYRQQFKGQIPEFSESYNFLPFYFSLSAGISFNLYPEFNIKNKK